MSPQLKGTFDEKIFDYCPNSKPQNSILGFLERTQE